MDLFRRGVRRRRLPVVAFAGTLFAFQAIALIGATSAQAASSCTRIGATVIISIDVGQWVEVSQDTTTTPATIMVDVNGGGFLTCTGATVANTTTIQVTGSTGDESFYLDTVNYLFAKSISWGTMNWTVDLGSGTGDYLEVYNGDNGSTPMNVAVGNSGIDLNNDGDLDVTFTGVEELQFDLGSGDDTFTAQGSTAAGAALSTSGIADFEVDGESGDDTIDGSNLPSEGEWAWGLFGDSGADTITRESAAISWVDAGGDTNDYITATKVNTVKDGGTEGDFYAGADVLDFSSLTSPLYLTNNDAWESGAGDCGAVTPVSCSNIWIDDTIYEMAGGTGNDTLVAAVDDTWLAGAAGDDALDGDGYAGVYADFSWSVATGVTADLVTGTATGDGTDTMTDITNMFGTGFDDTLTGDTADNELDGYDGNDSLDGGKGADILDGGSGSDWVDYSSRTRAVTADLSKATVGATTGACNDALEFVSGNATDDGTLDCLNAVENASLGSGDDTFVGNAFNNAVQPGGGANSLTGGAGSDTLDYSAYTAGVHIDLGGGAGSDDAIDSFENVTGTGFADSIIGSDTGNVIKSGAGIDNVRAGSGDDTINAGGGNDSVRAGSGDDDLYGRKGNDYLNGGSGSDFCKGGPGTDTVVSCEGGH